MNEEELLLKKKSRPRIGTFRIGRDSFLARDYVYLPSAYLKSATFHMQEVFDMMDVEMPNILFRVFQTPKAKEWNVRFPPERQYLIDHITEHGYDSDEPSGPMRHYHGVLRENCKRLLRSTGLACKKAGAGFRLTESWSPDARHDAVAGWITSDNKANVLALGCADVKDYDPLVWEQLDAGASFPDENRKQVGRPAMKVISDKDVIIDPEPFYNDEMVITRDPVSHRVKGSFPHPNLTHLLISDNRELLEKKLNEAVAWGLIMVNGSVAAADYYVEAIQNSLPTILFQHTGYTTDMACQAYKKAKKLMAAKKRNPHALAERAFPDDIGPGYHHPRWLKPFDENHVSDCEKLNILLENWPSKFNEDSVFIVDMFSTTEDELQDRLTQTMGVVFGPQHEVGGHMSESKRLTFAWRTRAKYMLNARLFKRQSDILNALLVLFTLLSTVSAVVYTFVNYNDDVFSGSRDFALAILLKCNLLLPLVATLLRGMISMFNPMNKYIALKNAAVKVEMEIYQYRTKVGKYSFRKPPPPSKDKSNAPQIVSPLLPPRVVFAKVLDDILNDLTASDIQHGSLKELTNEYDPMTDVNKRILSNRSVQECYSQPMKSSAEQKGKSSFKKPNLTFPAHNVVDIEQPLSSDAVDFEGQNAVNERVVSSKIDLNNRGEYNNWYRNTDAVHPSSDDAENDDDRQDLPLDDGLSLMTTDDYLAWRLLPMIAELSKKTPALSAWSSTFTICVLFLSVSAAALTAFNRSDFIPAALAVSGGVTAWASYQQTDLRLVLTNNSLQQLNQLMVWWDGLTMIEKRIPLNKETLVKTCELAIISQATVVGGAQSSKADGDKKGDGDESDKKKE